MTFDEFLSFRDVQIRNKAHEKIVRLFYPSLQSVCDDSQVLPNLIGKLIGVDLSDYKAETGCFNGVNDEAKAPFDDVDFYLRFDNGIHVFIYGSKRGKEEPPLEANEYAVFVLSDDLSGNIERRPNRYVYLT